jgi:hypothetical protein
MPKNPTFKAPPNHWPAISYRQADREHYHPLEQKQGVSGSKNFGYGMM